MLGTYCVNSEIALETQIVLSYALLEKNIKETVFASCVFRRKITFCHFKNGEDPNAIRLRVHDPI